MNATDEHRDEWNALTTDPRLIAVVDDALKVHHSSTPPIPVFHKGHAIGVVVRLSCQPWHARTEPYGDGNNRIRMQVEPTASSKEAGIIEFPSMPWYAYNFRCVKCGETMTAKARNLLRLALVALAGRGQKGAAYKIALT